VLVVPDILRSTDLPRGGVGAIGNFDGLHRGQTAILERVVDRAAALGAPAVVLSFDPHPRSVLQPQAAPKRLTTSGQRERLLEQLGIGVLALVRFTREFARTTAAQFAERVVSRALGLREVYVGTRFAFGQNREGDIETLARLGAGLGFVAHGVPEVEWQGLPISASRIREALETGAAEDAAAMLGRPYAIEGTIARGDRMGKRLGWPTINLSSENELIPADGVYTSLVYFPSFPATFECVTNIGTRPTLYENHGRVVESHVLDFRSDVYGERAELRFLGRLREERIFPSVMDLSAQISRDVEATREYFARRRRLQQEPAPAEYDTAVQGPIGSTD
jgi:riboflavin kinase/FMN adenylyltransferase